MIKDVVWSETKNPCEDCRYHHLVAHTPLGKFYIKWKEFKQFELEMCDKYISLYATNIEEAKIEANIQINNYIYDIIYFFTKE